MKGCRTARRRILRAVDQDLPLEERFRLDDHLAQCSACATEYQRALHLEEAFARMPDPPHARLDLERTVRSIRTSLENSPPSGDNATIVVAASSRAPSKTLRALAVIMAVAGVVALWIVVGARPRDVAAPEVNGVDAPENIAIAPSPTRAREAESSVARPNGESDPVAETDAASVERQLREHLVAAFADSTDLADIAHCVERFDRFAAPIRRWPLARIAAPMLRSDDLRLARSAARFLGMRGDRISVSQLQAVLDRHSSAARDSIAPVVVRALGDLGRDAVSALGHALSFPALEPAALAQLARIGGVEAARFIESSLARRADSPGSTGSTTPFARRRFEALAAIGTPAVASFLRLASDDNFEREQVLGWLDRVEGAGDEFARLMRARAIDDPDLVFEIAARLQPVAVLPWLEERASEHRYRARALACLERWDDTVPIRTLLRLDAAGWVPDADIVSSLRAIADRDGERFTALARDLLAAADPIVVDRYLDLLIASEHRAAASALVELTLANVLSDEARQWAALAVGELGGPEDATLLLAGVDRFGANECRLLAACLISIHLHLGEGGTAAALAGFAPRSIDRVNNALQQAIESDRDETRFTGGAVELFRVARSLEGAFLSRNPSIAKSSS